MSRRIIRVDGTEERVAQVCTSRRIRELIGAESGLDVVQLRHFGRPAQVMLVDDTGMIDGKPINQKATELYWLNCRPGTTHPICGDVFIAPDEDFA